MSNGLQRQADMIQERINQGIAPDETIVIQDKNHFNAVAEKYGNTWFGWTLDELHRITKDGQHIVLIREYPWEHPWKHPTE